MNHPPRAHSPPIPPPVFFLYHKKDKYVTLDGGWGVGIYTQKQGKHDLLR